MNLGCSGAYTNYPVSSTLSDGTVVNVGAYGVPVPAVPAGTNTFLGVTDSSGKGIVAVTIRVQGTNSGGSQSVYIDDLSFVVIPEPAVANPINLYASRDFCEVNNITASASSQLSSLTSLQQFRSLGKNNKHVYSFSTWPQSSASLGLSNYTFRFDLNGDGVNNALDQQVTVTYTGTYSASAALTRAAIAGAPSSSQVLGGVGDISTTAYAEHRFEFQRPVYAAGFVYRSPGGMNIQRNGGYPISYTLSDGTIVNLGTSGNLGASIPAGTNTFVGIVDPTGKGISSVTSRVQGSSSTLQPVYIDDLSFVVAGPPAGDWKLILNEEFNGTTLNTQIWSKGYLASMVINNELQGMVPENVTVANGLCTIKAEKRSVLNTDMYGSTNGNMMAYASGSIQTYNKWSYCYGYLEARVKMTSAKGTWSAFWMLPDRGPGVANVDDRVRIGNANGLGMGHELDVFEYMGSWKNPATGMSRSHSGLIWAYPPNSDSWADYALDNEGVGPAQYQLPNPDTTFHTYGAQWHPQHVTFFIDGKVVLRYTDPAKIANVPHYILLNVALSRNDWTHPDYRIPLEEIDAMLPSSMSVDYVRFWADKSLPAQREFILDTTSLSGVTITGNWSRWGMSLPGRYGADYFHDNNKEKGVRTIRFSPTLYDSGNYEVFLWWPGLAPNGTEPLPADNVPIDITHTGGTSTRTVNQRLNGGQWVSVGTYNFSAGNAGSVLIRTNNTTSRVLADAVRFLKQ